MKIQRGSPITKQFMSTPGMGIGTGIKNEDGITEKEENSVTEKEWKVLVKEENKWEND